MTWFGTMRGWACVMCLLTGCASAGGGIVNRASVRPRSPAVTAWERAQRGREGLEAMAEGTRTRAEYTRVLDLFRAIYHDAPGGAHAPASIFAVAELLAEEGRSLHEERLFAAAAGQYRFLRTQYPMSPLVAAALLAEGQLEQHELRDVAAARERYSLLIKQHPRSEPAGEARAALLGMQAEGLRTARHGSSASAGPPVALDPARGTTPELGEPSVGGASGRKTAGKAGSSLPAMPVTSDLGVPGRNTPAGDTIVASAQPVAADLPTVVGPVAAVRSAGGSRRAAVVSGIRHWSTRDYTRVAIDLGDEVTYEAARVPHPDRIFFDLHGTKLAPELVGKSFAVTDDGFLRRIRAAQATNDTTRVVLDVSDVTEYTAFLLPNPYRLIIDIHGRGKAVGGAGEDAGAQPGDEGLAPGARSAAAMGTHAPVREDSPAPRVAQPQTVTASKPVPNTVAVRSPGNELDVAALSQQPGKVEATGKPTSRPIASMTSIFSASGAGRSGGSGSRRRGKKGAADNVAGSPARAAVPTAAGETSLVRALGLKIGRIVIDAGHGGHDSGTLGAGGIQEKDVVLDVALRLGKMLHERLGAEIIYTRSDDTFIPLETRTAVANKAQADLFLSIHANSSPDETARGVETYYLNFTSQTDALEVAARENAVSGSSIHELSNLVKKIAMKDKIEESREFANDVEQALYSGLAAGNDGLKNRGVKKAPFVVLIGANMPSVLAEISFVTNERDAEELRRPEYRQRVAESLFKGVAKYEAGLGETRLPVEQASSE